MTVVLNGQSIELNLDESMSVMDLLSFKDFDPKKVAVAINGDFVPRSNYESVLIVENDEIEVLSAVQGG